MSGFHIPTMLMQGIKWHLLSSIQVIYLSVSLFLTHKHRDAAYYMLTIQAGL